MEMRTGINFYPKAGTGDILKEKKCLMMPKWDELVRSVLARDSSSINLQNYKTERIVHKRAYLDFVVDLINAPPGLIRITRVLF